jgi:hypothetical protein
MNKANTSPKARVFNVVQSIHPDANIEVRGTRVKGRFGGYFLAEVSANDKILARARHNDWRTAYRSLEIEFSKHWFE